MVHVYEPLYHAREVASIKYSLVTLEKEISKAYQYYLIVSNKTVIPLALVGYEIIIAHSALRASLAIYHLISNLRSWNNCLLYHARKIVTIKLTPGISYRAKSARSSNLS